MKIRGAAALILCLGATTSAATFSSSSSSSNNGSSISAAGLFRNVGRAPPGMSKTFTVGMVPRDFAGLDAALAAAADVRSPSYGHWLSQARVRRFMRPSRAARDAARAWATHTGASCVEQMSALRCRGTVAQVEALLST